MTNGSSRELVVEELQMLTGVQTDDVDLLFYNLVKDGCYFNNQQVKVNSDIVVPSLSEWFRSL